MLGETSLETRDFVISWALVLYRKETVRHHFAAGEGGSVPMSHHWHQEKAGDLLVGIFVISGTAASGICPHYLIEVQDVNVVANNKHTMDEPARFQLEDNLGKLVAHCFGGGGTSLEFLVVNLQDSPHNVRLERAPCCLDRESLFLSLVKNFRGN